MFNSTRTVFIFVILTGFFFGQLTLAEDNGSNEASRAGLTFDKFMLDPIGDVKIISSSNILTPTEGFDNIDIVKALSYQPLNDLGLVSQLEVTIELTVEDIILDDDDIYYLFIITADDEDYLVSYINGSCEGQSTDNPFSPSFKIDAEGSGTDTLNITLNLLNL